MAERKLPTEFALLFAPEHWTAVQKFQQFMGEPFEVRGELSKGTVAAANHLRKFDVLAGLANRLASGLHKDDAEVEERGHSPAIHSKEFAALIETLFCELYAALDGVRRTLYGAYRKVQGVQNKSTKTLFGRAKENVYGAEFPESIRLDLAASFDSWFPRLREIRTEVTHGDIGSCHWDKATGKIAYLHGGLGTGSQALVIDDVVAALNEKWHAVVQLVENVYSFLYGRLEPIERTIFCGVYKARIYSRNVAPTAAMSFQSGTCVSRPWFERETEFACPLREGCEAFKRAESNDEGANPTP